MYSMYGASATLLYSTDLQQKLVELKKSTTRLTLGTDLLSMLGITLISMD